MTAPSLTPDQKKRAERFIRCLLSSCAACGTTEADEYITVGDDHLTWFAGDEICGACAPEQGVA